MGKQIHDTVSSKSVLFKKWGWNNKIKKKGEHSPLAAINPAQLFAENSRPK